MKSTKKRGARLGQHFLTGEWAAKALANAALIQPGETVVEIGPGKGALTKILLSTSARVIAIEKDEALVRELHAAFANEIASGSLIVIEGDVRDITIDREPPKTTPDARRGESAARGVPERTTSAVLRLRNKADGVVLGGEYVLAANIPYYITGEIIRQFLSTNAQPRAIALLIQKEVADRIVARNHKESILSISVKVYGTPSIVAKVSKGNFSPPPSVDSAIILIDHISKRSFADIREEEFFKIVRAGFASKRKFLANNLAILFGRDAVAEAFARCDIALNTRAEDITLAQWLLITREFSSSR